MLSPLDTESIREALASFDASRLDRTGLREAVGGVRTIERALEALKVRIARRSDELAAAGSGPAADETLLSSGEVSGGTARRDAARATTSVEMPRFGDALQRGTVSGEHLDALSRAQKHCLDESERDALRALEPELLEAAERTPVDTFNRLARESINRIRADHGLGLAEQQRARSELRSWLNRATGMGEIHVTIDPGRHALLTESIERELSTLARAGSADGSPLERTPNLAAAALVSLVEGANSGGDTSESVSRRSRASVTVIVDADTVLNGCHAASIRETVDGFQLPPRAIDRMMCDAEIRRVTLDRRGVPIEVGRVSRTATDAQWAALRAVHATCAWLDCPLPISWCQAHHITWWRHGGRTDLANLIPLCSRHHHLVHEGGWTIELMADRTLLITRPDGAHHGRSTPDRAARPSIDLSRHQNRAGPDPVPTPNGSDPPPATGDPAANDRQVLESPHGNVADDGCRAECEQPLFAARPR